MRKPRLVHVPPEIPGLRKGRHFNGPVTRLNELVRAMTRRHTCYMYAAGPEFVIISPFEIEQGGLVGVYTKAPGVAALREDLGL